MLAFAWNNCELAYEAKIKALEAKLEIAVEALNNYADETRWSEPIKYISDFGIDYEDEKTKLFMTPEWDEKNSKMKYEKGGFEYAQEALNKLAEKEEE